MPPFVFPAVAPMTPNLTVANPDLDILIKRTPAQAMMFWAGTCLDPNAKCGACRFFGYETAVRNDAGNVVHTNKFPSSCLLYKEHTGRDGKPFPASTPACKYFAARAKG